MGVKALQQAKWNADHREMLWKQIDLLQESLTIKLLNERGEEEEFMLHPVPVLSDELALQYPSIKAFRGKSHVRKNVITRLTISPLGIHGLIKTLAGDLVFQPVRGQKDNYLFYMREHLPSAPSSARKCSTAVESSKSSALPSAQRSRKRTTGFKSYRFAVAATAEYTFYWGDGDPDNGTNREDAFAAIVNTVNRMNEVMETDLGIRLILVSDASFAFEDAETDPFGDDLNDEVQAFLTQQLGEANYDLGHLFHRSAPNGDAGSVGNVCRDTRKGSAFSAHSFTATNGSGGQFLTDYFDVDYVLHEVGHQFGATHSFAHETEGTGTNSEPGSGSTIMSYAGIIPGQNMQAHSDPYFHAHNLRQIHLYLQDYSCQVPLESTHQPPTVTAGEDVFIPSQTPYELVAQANDPDDDVLTYCWEQMDSGQVTAQQFGPRLVSGSTARSLLPKTSPKRTIPNMQRVLANQLTQTEPEEGDDWETVVEVSRSMRWGVTVRDRTQELPNGLGYTAFDEKSITVIADAGPFHVLSQNDASEVWQSGQTVDIAWDVAQTQAAPISSTAVNIYLSTDGGVNFDQPLLLNTPNDGQANISVPENISTSNARIKIVPTDNIYFAVNSVDFSIESTPFAVQTSSINALACDTQTVSFSFQLTPFETLESNVVVSTSGLPEDISVDISPTILSSSSNAGILTLTAPLGFEGDLQFSLTGTMSATTVRQPLKTTFASAGLAPPTLVAPANAATDQPDQLVLLWTPQSVSSGYRVEVSTNADFDPIFREIESETNSVTLEGLESLTTYYWRVVNTNICGESPPSAASNFTVTEITCANFSPEGLPVSLLDAISISISQNTLVNIAVPDDLTILDINVKVKIRHTYLEDLTLTLISPSSERILLSENIGSDNDNYTDTVFDAEAPLGILIGSPPYTGAFRPEGDLTQLYGQSAQGLWRFEVNDDYPEDVGVIESVELQLCLDGAIQVNSDSDLIVDVLDNCPLISNPGQEDFDNDGEGDICDIDGQNNFSVAKTDETCRDQNNGSLRIAAMAQFDYVATVVGPDGFARVQSFSSSSDVLFDNLSQGDYLACITSSNVPDFEQCFVVTINEPAPLNVAARVDAMANKLFLSLSGNDTFILIHNQKVDRFENKNQVIIDLKKGLNVIEVTTPIACQGNVIKKIYVSEDSSLYPNPVENQLNVLVGGEEISAEISVYNMQGRLYFSEVLNFTATERQIEMDVDDWEVGQYVVKITRESTTETLKFIKR